MLYFDNYFHNNEYILCFLELVLTSLIILAMLALITCYFCVKIIRFDTVLESVLTTTICWLIIDVLTIICLWIHRIKIGNLEYTRSWQILSRLFEVIC
jgi:hypothetical protein